MPLRRLAIILLALLVFGEGALALWRHLPIPVSTAPVFSFPPAARVLQAGVFNAPDADHAWQTFRTQVLDHLEW